MAKTGVSKFRFVSPGVQVAEIDNSQIPKEPEPIGPVIIGRALRGPGLRPVKVDSFSEFVEIFGNPQPGGFGHDVWRRGGEGLAPTYGAYAAQAWFKNNTPVTFVRLLGKVNTDKVSGGEAGWKVGTTYTDDSTGGAYGLFLIDSGTILGLKSAATTGTLAAVFYCRNGHVALSGTLWGDSNDAGGDLSGSATGGVAHAINSTGVNKQFKATVGTGSTQNVKEIITFDFNRDSPNYIRKVFNTNPTLVDSNERQYAAGAAKNYFLGETFDRDVAEKIKNTGGNGSRIIGFTSPLLNTTTDWNINQSSLQRATTGWVISQDLGSSANYSPEVEIIAQRLFRFRTLEGGDWEQKNLKISIADIKAPANQYEKYGSFTVQVRMAKDSDAAPILVESFTNCTLNKESPNYIAARIGDSYAEWSDTDRRYRDYGDYPNRSRYIFVEMNPDEPWLASNELVPFGYRGPLRFVGFKVTSSDNIGTVASVSSPLYMIKSGSYTTADYKGVNAAAMCKPVGTKGLNDIIATFVTGAHFGEVQLTDAGLTASFQFPRSRLRQSTEQGNLASPREAYWGVDTTRSGSSIAFDESYMDYVLGLPDDYRSDTTGPTISATADTTEYSYIFSLDDITRHSGSVAPGINISDEASSTQAYYLSGSRRAGVSLSATGTNNYTSSLDAGFDQFTMPLFGGFNGVNILERNPFNNSTYGTGGKSEFTSYAYNSIKVAMDACSDPEVVECNIMSAPGIVTPGLTNHLMDICERRGDALAVVDTEDQFIPREDRSTYVSSDSDSTVRGSVTNAINTLNDRAINNSYATTYYPWVKIKDQQTGMNVWTPPSVAAIGTYANTDSNFELWFAPAGFTRGGLSEGAAGLPVIGLKQRLTSKDRDRLYEANINPIAQFPAEGIVMFGQKTLQKTRSALDRINVRRLMIHVKKEISRIASRLLFDQNVTTTWDRFTGQVTPFLDSIRYRLGLEDYRVILDASTTTPDLIDRNVMYAKIFLKPARAIEFIAIDFVITNSGAAFED